MRFAPLFALAVACIAACAPTKSAEVKAPDAVDRMPRAEVEAIVKDYLVKNPEVLALAFAELDRREKDKEGLRLASLAGQFAAKSEPAIGPKDAKVTVIEFFDFNCAYCRAANDWVFAHAEDKRDPVRVIFKQLPILESRTGTSVNAAKAALAANRQGKYREMHLALMHAHDLSPDNVNKMAQSIGLDMERMKKDMASPEIAQQIQNAGAEAESAKIEGTPGFFINGQFLNGFSEERLDDMMKTARAKTKA